jgi:hypothetical protein
MSHLRGGFGTLTPKRTYREEPTAPAGGAFAALLTSPARGSFVMPATATLALIAPGGGYDGNVTITAPDGSVRVLPSRGLHSGNRVATAQPVPKGSRVDVEGGLEVQVSVGALEWRTIAQG